MGKHALLAVISILILSFGVGCIFLYKYANVGIFETPSFQADEYLSEEKIKSHNDSGWLSQLATIAKSDYSLPVNEIYIEYKQPVKIDNIKNKNAYQLLINKNDIYSMFCVSQVLKSSGVDFAIVKNSLKNQIYLNTQDVNILERIVKDLQEYDIRSKVTEVKL